MDKLVKLSFFQLSFGFDIVNTLQGLTLFCALFFDDAVLRQIKLECQWITGKNNGQIQNGEESITLHLKDLYSNVSRNNRRVYNLDQNLPEQEERFICSYRQHSNEF